MLPKIFDIENGQLIVNENILAIPELKAVYEAYDDPKPALLFLNYLCDPMSPYNQIPEAIKEESVMNDFPGEYTTEDEVIINAIEKLRFLWTTPSYRYYLDNKKLLETLGRFAATASVRDTDKGGNLVTLQSQLNNLAKTMTSFKQFEKMVEEELQASKVRGNAFQAYDQMED